MSAGTITSPDVDIEFLIHEEPQEPIYCDSVLHLRKPPHEADWWAEGACGDRLAVCEGRRVQCKRDDGWFCTLGCNAHHDYDQIGWYRVVR